MKKTIPILLRAGAIGDAMGYLIEFDGPSAIQKKYGPNGLTADHFLACHPWVVSDDTQMTLFYLESLLHNEKDSGYKAFQRWYVTQSHHMPSSTAQGLLAHAALYARQAPGMTCMSALATKECFDVHRRANDSKGCGSIMRTMPSILMERPDAIFAEACLQSARTHGHDLGMLASGWFAVWLGMVRSSHDIAFWYETVKTISQQWCHDHQCSEGYHQEMVGLTDRVLRAWQNSTVLTWDSLTDTFGEGWIAESAYALSLYAGIKAKTFEEALHISINHKGDSDSTGSLAAQVYASLHMTTIEQERLYLASKDRLDVHEAIHDLVVLC